MIKKYKEKWIAALRSGDYRQNRGSLRRMVDETNFGYCCLGVLCEVLKEDKKLCQEGFVFENDQCIYSGAIGYASLPTKLLERLKIEVKTQDKLITMNDYKHRNFKEIANYISRYL